MGVGAGKDSILVWRWRTHKAGTVREAGLGAQSMQERGGAQEAVWEKIGITPVNHGYHYGGGRRLQLLPLRQRYGHDVVPKR